MKYARRSATCRRRFGVYPKVSAENLLGHFALLKGIAERRARKEVVEALLRQTNLWEGRKQQLGRYSGGMRQRFGVAVAPLGNPKLTTVDEPTAGLDPAESARFLNLSSELGETSVVLISTHIVEDVSELCTRMAIIDRGRSCSRPTLNVHTHSPTCVNCCRFNSEWNRNGSGP